MTVPNKVISLGYTPRPIQAFLHMTKRQRQIRFMVAVCHRRFGKTKFALAEIATSGFECQHHNPQYAYIAPTYGQAERIAWSYLKEMFSEYPGVEKNEQKLRLRIPRHDRGDFITIWLLGAENPDSIRGIYLDGCIFDEYAQMSPMIWGEVVRPLLSDRKGWAIFIGTPKGMNQFYKMHQTAQVNMVKEPHLKWFSFSAPASRTGIIDEDELKALKAEMSEEEYDQEFECSFQAAMVGSYYGKQMVQAEAREMIGEVPYDPRYLVNTYWDIGIDDSTAIWFTQTVGEYEHVIDYLEMSGEGLEYYAEQLGKKGYRYGEHYFPHDGANREWSSGDSRVKTASSLLSSRPKLAKKVGTADKINAVRMLIPMCKFDKIKCMRGLDALKNYERKWDAKNGIFQDSPLHNWASHGSDAFAVFAVCRRSKSSVNLKQLPRSVEVSKTAWR
jgi:phage terminase large subunit